MAALAIAGAVALLPAAARACSHLWRVAELYSSPDRTIQYIEMREIEGSSIEVQIGMRWLATNTYNVNHQLQLGQDLVGDTAFKRFLIGTQSYASLPGAPAPDYVVPDGILNPEGDRIVWYFYQTLPIPPATMPSDGIHSVDVIGTSSPTFQVALPSPTNFAGETGTISLPNGVPALGGQVGVILLGTALLSMAALALSRAAAR